MDFAVIDVETANETPSSICQIAVVHFSNGKLTATWGTLVNPEDSFLPFNVRLHGIRPEDVLKAKTWPHIQPFIGSLLEAKLVASHTAFDRTALQGANRRYGLQSIKTAGWIDTCSAARMAWPHLSSYRLMYLARCLRIRYQPHDAREDARCAGEVLLRAAKLNGQVKSLLALDPGVPSETSLKSVRPEGTNKIWRKL